MRNYVTAFATLLLSACGVCSDDPLNFASSPDGRLNAYAFEQRCLASDVTTHVSIVEAGHNLSEFEGNVLTTNGEYPLSVDWQGNSTLVVHGVVGMKLSQFHAQVKHVRIDYVEE